jgi:hypothetical protein
MNQYLNETNQNMLWKVINNAPQVIQAFQNYPPGTKEKWFQSVIKNVYQQLNGSNFPLKELNKRTLDYMLQNLEQQQQQKPQTQILEQPRKPILEQPRKPILEQNYKQNPSFADQTHFVKSQEQIVVEQFELRKKEYESMTKKTVPTPDFTNAIKDEAINDIGSAIEAYMKQRDADIPVYAPIKPSDGVVVEEIVKKHVQWGDNTERTFDNQQPVIDYSVKIKSLEECIQSMEKTITELAGKINKLENMFTNINTAR